MNATLQQLKGWLAANENEHLEFKEAKARFDFEELVKYCAALANEGGGEIILGVTDKRPRRIVGSNAFHDIERTKAGLIERLRLRIDATELSHPDGRVVVVHVPPRPLGVPIGYKGAFWMRAGEDLAPMTPDMLKRIFEETAPDFSAEICASALLHDLEGAAIEVFRSRWAAKAQNQSILHLPVEQLLLDAELITPDGITYAALVLLGGAKALSRFLPQAEVVFEYRSVESAGPAAQRIEFREGFLLFYDRLWAAVNLRNDLQHYQEGLFMVDVPTFSEGSVREAILNAIGHRDYRHQGSAFVRQFARRIEVVSPGGFPPGITADNILDQQLPRNRRIAESFGRCGLVERSGQGANRMFEESVKQSKPLPDYSKSGPFQVWLTLEGEVQDPAFLRFLERVGAERMAHFDTHDFVILSMIADGRAIPAECKPRVARLVEQGVVEHVGRGKLILSKRFYTFIGRKGTYTHKKGLDRETQKALLVQHIEDSGSDGSPLQELMQVLPNLSRAQIQALMRELRGEKRVHNVGTTRNARWFTGAGTAIGKSRTEGA